MIGGRPEALTLLHDALAVHADPEALFLYASCLAYAGDDASALASLTRAVETGYHVPTALRKAPWLERLRGEGRLDTLVASAEAARHAATLAFLDASGEALLGAGTAGA